ncbi:ribbon-helix-helix domain-containing protein [Streptosporangium sp. KLBMP 9127]|nr:ribbon-helix-helix domain-containing protein [Streptosporangium sp. KLBMP 9127]
MKTAISIPDETFSKVEQQAAALGMSRSEFYTRAAQEYLQRLEQKTLTRQIDAALELAGYDDSGAVAVEAGRRVLSADDEW